MDASVLEFSVAPCLAMGNLSLIMKAMGAQVLFLSTNSLLLKF